MLALLDASGGDPFLRWDVDRFGPVEGWVDDDSGAVAVVRVGAYSGRRGLVALGDADAAAGLAARVLDYAPGVAALTLPATAASPSRAGLRMLDSWQWRWTEVPPEPHPGEGDVVPVADLDAVQRLLDAASPQHSRGAHDVRVTGWVGVWRAGVLVACAAHEATAGQVPHLVSIAVLPSMRAQGLGTAVTAALTRGLLRDGAPAVTLGVFADNAAAATVYDRLGLRTAWTFRTWALVDQA